MTGSASIFRIDSTGETETDAKNAGQIIEFNDGATPDARSFLETARWQWIEDTSRHPNPKKALNKIQDGLLGTRELILTGWFEDPDNAGAMAVISNWMKAAKTNASLSNGRFGVRINDLSTLDINPSATTAYLLYDAEVEIPRDTPYEANFTLKLWLNGTHP